MARPFGTLKYDNLQDLQTGIDRYFDDCDANNRPYTMYDLALALNVDRGTLLNYSKMDAPVDDDGDSYFRTIKYAREKVKAYAERRLYDKEGIQGAKFNLINNARADGWSDRQEVALDGQVINIMSDLLDE